MARIRTIKPEFWTDEKIVQLPYEARLLYIGMWNFADDEGFLTDEPERIRMQVLPADDVDAEMLIDLLVVAGFLDRVELKDGSFAISIVHFAEHQKVSNPTKSRIGTEFSRKLCTSQTARRQIAIKYGVEPGGEGKATCYYCGNEGGIWWPLTSKGKPGYWVAFSRLEIDHFIAESNGGVSSCENYVLACRRCNRSKGAKNPFQFVLPGIVQSSLESSREVQNILSGMEGNGMEKEGNNTDSSVVEDSTTEQPVLTFPCNGNPGNWKLTQQQIDEWAVLYPSVDILCESRKALAWIRANTRKTAKGMPKFLVGWFGRANDRRTGHTAPPRQTQTAKDIMRLLED